MTVNGLLLTMSPDTRLTEHALAQIAARPEATLGDPSGIYQTVAVECPDVGSAHDFHEWLEALDGVGQVDVIFVGFETLSDNTP